MRRSRPDVQPVISRATTLPRDLYKDVGFPVVDDTRALLRHARAGLVKSGTSTLEAALEVTPFVVAYRMAPLSWQIVKRVLRVKNVSLANLVAGADIVPELLQDDAVPERLAEVLVPLLDDASPAYQKQVEGLSKIGALLGTPGASERVAELRIGLLRARAGGTRRGRSSRAVGGRGAQAGVAGFAHRCYGSGESIGRNASRNRSLGGRQHFADI